jgi:type IV pilus assembly protein PilM
MFGSGGQLVGLDIGTHAIKAVVLEERGEGYSLRRFGYRNLEPELIVDRAVMDPKKVSETIRDLFSEVGIRNKHVVVSVSGLSIIVKNIHIPEMSEEELEVSIQWEAEQYIPFDISDVNLDFQILGPSSRGSGQMEVLLVAVKREKLQEYTSLVADVGLKPTIVDVDAFALANCFEHNHVVNEGQLIALIDIGAGTTNLNVMNGAKLSFTRDMMIGGNQYTLAIQKEFGIGFDEAETLKRGQDTSGVSHDDCVPVLEKVSEDLFSEILRSLEFYKATTQSDASVEKMVISGGCSKLPGLQDFLSEKLGMEIETLDPLRAIDCQLRREDREHVSAVAVGLGLRKASDR